MKLYITAPSPYARKCRIVAREKGLADRVREIAADPYADAPELLASNPLVQVPVLIAEDGLPLTDSPLICEYLDTLSAGPRLLPETGPERLRVRRIETLASGALEAGVKLVLEKRRPENERSPSWMARWTAGIERSLDALEALPLESEPLHLGTITAAVAGTWLGFRHPDTDWLAGRPRLAALTAKLEEREGFRTTHPSQG